jgi:hypothetical protein
MKDENKGQQKQHVATRVNPTTGETETKTFTQQEWRQRDKSEGWSRPESEDEGADETEANNDVDPTVQ